jgi:hypothetical protein
MTIGYMQPNEMHLYAQQTTLGHPKLDVKISTKQVRQKQGTKMKLHATLFMNKLLQKIAWIPLIL